MAIVTITPMNQRYCYQKVIGVFSIGWLVIPYDIWPSTEVPAIYSNGVVSCCSHWLVLL
jgi:hypothetical protein